MAKLIVVTGGAGFVGSHLCERLVRDGHRVISLDNYFTGSVANHVSGVEYRTGHTKDIASLVPEVPEIIFHLGEYARTEKSFEDIEIVWDLNKTGTFAVLEYARRTKAKLIYAGSSTKFADGGSGRDQSPYAWSKATNTELVENYAEWFGLNYAITYFYNVYGPREMSGAYGTLIKIFSDLHKNGQPLTVTAPGTQTRNFTHVEDIVNGLVLVGDSGQGDGYGIGADEMYGVLEVAKMFGGEIIMLPERKGNRLMGGVDNAQVKALGWQQQHRLPDWIAKVKEESGTVVAQEQRILVFSTTFYPHAGPAEHALVDLIKTLPHVHFDIVTTRFAKNAPTVLEGLANLTVHRVGYGYIIDKYLLPIAGARIATRLRRDHSYMFMWSLFASYGALAAFMSFGKRTPHLITLADQKLGSVPWFARFVLARALGSADQIYAMDTYEARQALSITKRTNLVRSVGQGDVFANQLRVAYSDFLRSRISK